MTNQLLQKKEEVIKFLSDGKIDEAKNLAKKITADLWNIGDKELGFFFNKLFYEGRLFVFFTPPENFSFNIKVNRTDKESTEEIKTSENILIPRYNNRINFEGVEISPLDLSKLYIDAVVTDRKIYKPTDTVRVIAGCLNRANESIKIKLYKNNQLMLEETQSLDKFGLKLHELKDLDLGEYRVDICTIDDSSISSCDFSVAEYTLSPLVAILEESNVENDVVKFTINITQLNIPYNGKVEIGLFCGVCNSVVSTHNFTAKDGYFSGEITMSGHGGPFTFHLSTPNGNTATIYLPSTKSEERQDIRVCSLGKEINATLMPHKGADKTHNLFLYQTGVSTTPFILESIITERAEITTTSAMEKVVVVVINPATKESKVYNYSDVKKSATLNLPVFPPYSIINIGAIIDGKPYETFTAVFSPETCKAEMSLPTKCKPGEEVTVKIKVISNRLSVSSQTTDNRLPITDYQSPITNNKVSCLLLAYDARLEREDLLKNFAKKIYFNVKDNLNSMSSSGVFSLGTCGFMDLIDNPNFESPKISSYYIGKHRVAVFNVRDVKWVFLEDPSSSIKEVKEDLGDDIVLVKVSKEFMNRFISPYEETITGGFPEGEMAMEDMVAQKVVASPVMFQRLGIGFLANAFVSEEPSPKLKRGMPKKMAKMAMKGIAEDKADYDTTTGTDEVETAVGTLRMEFPELIHCELFEMTGDTAERTIKFGDQIGKWKVVLQVFSGFSFSSVESLVETGKDAYIDFDLPAFVAKGDKIQCKAIYFTPKQATMSITSATSKLEKETRGTGTEWLEITSPGEIIGKINIDGSDVDIVSRVIGAPGVHKITTSEIKIMKIGDTVDGEKVIVYPSIAYLLQDTVKSLMQYPFG